MKAFIFLVKELQCQSSNIFPGCLLLMESGILSLLTAQGNALLKELPNSMAETEEHLDY